MLRHQAHSSGRSVSEKPVNKPKKKKDVERSGGSSVHLGVYFETHRQGKLNSLEDLPILMSRKSWNLYVRS